MVTAEELAWYQERVDWFGRSMLEKLIENDHKGGWDDCEPEWLLDRLQEELNELRAAVLHGRGDVRREAADVANFCMFLADVAG